ncbi:unnamed protein product [Coregonus sp. 'balchen']|nr:unnamed protein product [Coregonus sp. 'balchen']
MENGRVIECPVCIEAAGSEYKLRNRGPSTFSKAMLDVEWPYRFTNGSLLYITKLEVDGDGGMNCSTDMEINPLNNPLSGEKNITSPSGGGDRTEGRNRNHDCSKVQCLKIRCQVGRVERGQSAILYIHSRLGVATFLKVSMSVIWVKSDPEPVPWWVVTLALIAGLLLLALLIFIMYKLGFFKRVRPPQEDATEKEQLAPQENGDRNTDA